MAAKLAALGPLATVSGKAAPASPPPFTGEGQGGGMQKGSRVRATPSPPLPRKRGRERTERVAREHRACGESAPSLRQCRVGKGANRSARSAAGAPCPRGRKNDNVIACRVSATLGKIRVGN